MNGDKENGDDIKKDIVFDVVTGGGKKMKFWSQWGRGMYLSLIHI